jgi:Dyp-type peroxidase family
VNASATRLSPIELADIQGFVTSGYGLLPSAAYMFLRIEDRGAAQRWLQRLMPSISSGVLGPKDAPPPAVNVAFTAAGLAALGLPPSVICTFPPEFQDGITHPRRSRILGDTDASAPATWEIGRDATDLHLVVLVHAATDAERDTTLRHVHTQAGETGGGVREIDGSPQIGYRPRGDYEPFGFHDGLAQPRVQGLAGEGVPTGECILGYLNHYELFPQVPVLPANLDADGTLPALQNPHHPPGTWRDFGRHGTFIVYRKLRQDVAGFWRFMRDESARLAGGPPDAVAMVRLAAKCVGRWPSGAPLALAPDRDVPSLGQQDDFLYGHDPDGMACPLGAHVRRAHPRDVLKPYEPAVSRSMSEAHRLLRRARVFGAPLFDPELLRRPSEVDAARVLLGLEDDGRDRGIHFFAVNASIASQFEFVQQTWCNNPHFSGLYDNKDPVVGDHGGDGQAPSHMTIPEDRGTVRTSALPRFVTVRGGAYLFMPSLTALRFLATLQPVLSARASTLQR